MKKLLIAVSCLLCMTSYSQEFPNPFVDHVVAFNLEDLMIIRTSQQSDSIIQAVYGYNWVGHYGGQTSNIIVPLTPASTLQNTALGSHSFLTASSGRFNDDRRDDVFYALESDDGIRCTLNNLSEEFIEADSTYSYELAVPNTYLTLNNTANSGVPKITLGDYDADGNTESAIAWWEPALNLIHIQILDTDNSLTLESRAFINDKSSLKINGSAHAYDLSAVDLNGDGAAELVLIGIEESQSGDALYQVFIQVYEVNTIGCQTITPKAYLVLDDEHLADSEINTDCDLFYAQTSVTHILRNEIGGGDLTEDIMAGFALYLGGANDPCNNYDNLYQFLLRSSSDLMELTITNAFSQDMGNSFQTNYPLEAKSGDLNGDYIQDVVVLTNAGRIFTVIDDIIEYKGNIGGITLEENSPGILESIDRMELGDVDQDGRDEVIIFSKYNNGDGQVSFTLSARGVLDDFVGENLGGSGLTIYENSTSNMNAYAIAVGNFDGRDIKFGEPEIIECDYVQPTYIIGAIPSHFDVINGVQYDLTQCYPAQDCQMEVSVTQTSATSSQADVQINSDWAVGVEENATIEIPGWGVDLGASMNWKYDEKFSNLQSNTASQTISISITASADDMIQYITIPISVWEIPILDAANDTVSYVVAAFPEPGFSPQTIVANGKSLFNYLPDYEIGNLLSYPLLSSSYNYVNDLPTVAGNWIILSDEIPSYSMSPSGGITYTLTSNNGIDWTDTNTSSESTELGASVKGFGAGVTGSITVEEGQMNMFKSTISEETEFKIQPVNVIGAPNQYNYVISPKIYWGNTGEGVVSFDLGIDYSQGTDSWWSTTYTAKPDPALNLPYRYDQVIYPELINTSNLDRTKSIRFSSYLPQVGDTVSLFLKTFNYSFFAITSPVEFQLYHGNPDNGGTLMEDVDGNSLFHTETGLGIRGRIETEIRFVTSFEMINEDFTKIYVVLDPNNLLDEIHEDNNVGWAQLGYGCNQPGVSTGIDDFSGNLSEAEVLTTFPVPANEQLIIGYDMRKLNSTKGWVTVTNLLGQTLKHFRINTNYEGKIYWDISDIDNGIYIISLWSEKGLHSTQNIIVHH